MSKQTLKTISQLFAAGALAIAGHSAVAAGTASGTTISNTATVNYSVGTGASAVAQTPIDSNQVDFVVDNKVDFNVTLQTADPLTVKPGQTGLVSTFKITNTGNTTQGYILSAVATSGGVDFTPTLSIVLDDGDGTYNAATDTTVYTGGTNAGDLNPNTATPAVDAEMVVHVLATIPGTAADAESATYFLKAVTADAGSAVNSGAATATTSDSGAADTAGSVDVVFADAAGAAGSNDLQYDGLASASITYDVSSADVTISKTSLVISDPFSSSNPKAIPGAVVRYVIAVANAATASEDATSVVISDAMPANVTYNTGTLRIGNALADPTDVSGLTVLTDIADADAGANDGANATVNIGTLAPAATRFITFDVTVD